MKFAKIVVAFFALAGTFLLPACNYSLGSRGELDFSTIVVEPIKNSADIPQAQATLARTIADSLNTEPGLKTVTNNGQARLFVEISNYKRSVATTGRKDSRVATTVTLTLTLKCSLLDTRTGKYYFRDRTVSAKTESYPSAASGLAETQAFPVLARTAARRVKDTIVSVW